MRFNSVRFKIRILYTAILGLILVVYSAFLYLSLHYTLYDELDEELRIKAESLTGAIDSYLDVLGRDRATFFFIAKRAITFNRKHPHIDKIADIDKQWLLRADKLDIKEDIIRFTDTKRRPVAMLNTISRFPVYISVQDFRKIEKGRPVFKTVRFKSRALRIIYSSFYLNTDMYIVEVGTSLKPIIQLLANRLYVIVISIVAVLALTSFIGGIFANRILKPVVEITRTARNLTHEDLSARVKTEHIDTEMRYLSDAFNDMLSRLEQAFRYIGEFSSHVAHELKTPLTIIRGESEVTLRKDRDKEEYKRVIRVTKEETKRMLKTIDDLLLLARMDYKTEAFKSDRFDFTELIREIYEQVKMLAAEKDIAVSLKMPEGPVMISADGLHLRRLFFNIVDNARKFTPKTGKIDISVGLQAGNLVVSISDTGTGIARDDLPKIFDRFFHKDISSEEIEPGTGLGLSICREIAKAHKGDIRVVSAPAKGSTFIITLPLP